MTYNGKAVVLDNASFHQRADEISYNNVTSGMSETNVQTAIDKLSSNTTKLRTDVNAIPVNAASLPFNSDNNIKEILIFMTKIIEKYYKF